MRTENSNIILALNMDATGSEQQAQPPKAIMLVPPGNHIEGRDGRTWNNTTPAKIIQHFEANGLDIPVDIEHATHLKAPQGNPAPAVGWCNGLEARSDGSVWGNIEWNDAGRDMVLNRQYRYYSPVFVVASKSMEIAGIASIALTNKPNLEVSALNREETKGEENMNITQLLTALGLPATATFEDALNHIGKLKGDLTLALNTANNPPLDKFVPKADYDLALNRVTEAETKLAEHSKAVLETAINTEITAALKAGKITPATQDYHIEQCRQSGGLDRFKAFVAAAPAVAIDSALNTKTPDGTETAMNSELMKMAEMMGNTAEDIKKYGGI